MSNKSKKIKIILLGKSGVGKTNLINAFCNFEFDHNSETTSGSLCFEKEYNYKKKSYKYAIWDTAGQERFRLINKLIIRGSKIILIVYAIDNKNSFNEVDFWINYTKEILGEDEYIIALVANKSDLYEHQVVMNEEGLEAAKKYGLELFFTTSVLNERKQFQDFVKMLIKII